MSRWGRPVFLLSTRPYEAVFLPRDGDERAPADRSALARDQEHENPEGEAAGPDVVAGGIDGRLLGGRVGSSAQAFWSARVQARRASIERVMLVSDVPEGIVGEDGNAEGDAGGGGEDEITER